MHSHYPKMADTIRRSPFATQRRALDEPIFWATLTIIVEFRGRALQKKRINDGTCQICNLVRKIPRIQGSINTYLANLTLPDSGPRESKLVKSQLWN